MKWIAMCTALLSTAGATAYAQYSDNEYDVIYASAPQAERAERGVLIALDRYMDATIAVGASGTILIKHGNSAWQQAEVPTSVLLTAVQYVDAELIWAAGHDGVLLKSSDAGITWQRMLDGYQLLTMELDWLEERESYLTEAMDATEDEDEAADYEFLLDELAFQRQAAEIQTEVGPTKPFMDIHFLNADHGFAVGAYGTMLETTDGGETWTVVTERLDNPTAFHLNKIISNQNGDVFIIGEAGQLFRSVDNGETFDVLDSPYNGSLFGGLFDQQGRLWVYGLRGNVFVSDDDGDTFEAIDAQTRYNLNGGTLMADGTVVIAGHSGTLLFFDPETLQGERYEHASNAPLSHVLQNTGNELILVGRNGILQFIYPAPAAQ